MTSQPIAKNEAVVSKRSMHRASWILIWTASLRDNRLLFQSRLGVR